MWIPPSLFCICKIQIIIVPPLGRCTMQPSLTQWLGVWPLSNVHLYYWGHQWNYFTKCSSVRRRAIVNEEKVWRHSRDENGGYLGLVHFQNSATLTTVWAAQSHGYIPIPLLSHSRSLFLVLADSDIGGKWDLLHWVVVVRIKRVDAHVAGTRHVVSSFTRVTNFSD